MVVGRIRAVRSGLRRGRNLELEAGGQTQPSGELLALNRTSRGLGLQLAVSVVVLLVVVDMIWKPGA